MHWSSLYVIILAKRLAEKPPASMRLTKTLIKQNISVKLDDIIIEEGLHFADRLKSPEAKEAFAAFYDRFDCAVSVQNHHRIVLTDSAAFLSGYSNLAENTDFDSGSGGADLLPRRSDRPFSRSMVLESLRIAPDADSAVAQYLQRFTRSRSCLPRSQPGQL